MKNSFLILVLLIPYLISESCTDKPGNDLMESEKIPVIYPDYSGILIPYNIAPLNFRINEPGTAYHARISAGSDNIDVSSGNGIIRINHRRWSSFTSANKGKVFGITVYVKNKEKWVRFREIKSTIAEEPVDPYLYYRILYPGYESWSRLSIVMRNISDFSVKPVIENSVAEDNCVNCHAFNNGKTDDFLFHMRGTLGGTYFYSGEKFRKLNLKTKEMKNGAVYPRWHPSGKYVAFSANKIIQRFHAADNKKVEVSDLESSLVLYDVENNEMSDLYVPDKEKFMDTYPEWSPDGKYLYFCRAAQIAESFEYRDVRYNLYRMPFNASDKSTGEPELVFDADSLGKSVAFPRISPGGRYLVFTLADYGCFPIWHKEADLWCIDLAETKAGPLDLNSSSTESYHSWSSNGRWIVFSSKREDGLTARPYIAYMDENGKASKPFILPQENPDYYGESLKTFNIPEFATLDVGTNPGKMRRAAFSEAVQAKWKNSFVTSLFTGETK